jgi:hypothetical protein
MIAELFTLVYLLCALLTFALETIGVHEMRKHIPDYPRPDLLKLLLGALKDPWIGPAVALRQLKMLYGRQPIVVVKGPELTDEQRQHLNFSVCRCVCDGCVVAHREQVAWLRKLQGPGKP